MKRLIYTIYFVLVLFSAPVFAMCDTGCGVYANYKSELTLNRTTLTYIFLGIVRTLPDGTKITIILTTDKAAQINFFISILNISPNLVYVVANKNENGTFYNKTLTPNDAIQIMKHIPGSMSIINGQVYTIDKNILKKVKVVN